MKFKGCPTSPIGKRGVVKFETLAAHDLCLPIKRQMIGVLETNTRATSGWSTVIEPVVQPRTTAIAISFNPRFRRSIRGLDGACLTERAAAPDRSFEAWHAAGKSDRATAWLPPALKRSTQRATILAETPLDLRRLGLRDIPLYHGITARAISSRPSATVTFNKYEMVNGGVPLHDKHPRPPQKEESLPLGRVLFRRAKQSAGVHVEDFASWTFGPIGGAFSGTPDSCFWAFDLSSPDPWRRCRTLHRSLRPIQSCRSKSKPCNP